MAANGILNFQGTNKATFVGASSNIVLDTVTSSLGVGVDVNGPTSNLHVVGNAYVSTDVTIAGNIDFHTITQDGATFSGGSGSSKWAIVNTNDIHYSSGNVGIGTSASTPASKLDVNGTVTANAFSGSGSGLTALNAANITTGTLPVARGGTGTTTSTGTAGTSVVLSAAPSFTGDVTFDTNTLFVDSVNNRVGVGTTSPGYTLDVTGDINIPTGGEIRKGGVVQTLGSIFSTDSTKAYYTDGPVGIANISALTTLTLQIGANVSVDDVSSDKLVVDGNVYVSRALRAIDLVESYEVRANFFTVKNIDIRAERPRQGGVIS